MNETLVLDGNRQVVHRLCAVALCLLLSLVAAESRANILDVTVTGGGVVTEPQLGIECTSSGGTCQFDSGTATITADLTASPAPGQIFDGWGGDCAAAGTSPNCAVVIEGDLGTPATQSVTARFVPATVNLGVELTGSGTGSVQSNVPGIACPGDCSEPYARGSQITLTATPGATAVFTGWAGGGCSGTGNCTVNLADDTIVFANFDNDADGDGVVDADDACPGTPAGEPVDGTGCASSQLDDDGDGVSNDLDQCPNTPAGETADGDGCAPSQLDGDGDGVSDDLDQCPDTPAGAQVDADGCAPSQLDEDGDGVSDELDQCPNTPAGEPVDADGCGASQLDEDNDGVGNDLDQCPDTPDGASVDATGCSEVQRFGNVLGELEGLTAPERRLGARLDEICPLLVVEGDAGNLDAGQQDLREACSRLKDRDTTEDQAADALGQALNSQLPALRDYTVELMQSQFRHLYSRMRERRSGGGSGASVAGLNLRVNDETVPSAMVQSAFDGLLGMGASEEEPFGDFGKLGLFLQGDVDIGERDSDAFENGYDFDTWNLLFGADYRFTDDFFAGGSLSYGEVAIDHHDGRGETDMDQWALSLYAGWQITEHWYLDGLFSYGESNFDLERTVYYEDVGGNFESVHEGDTDGDQTIFGLNTGYTWNRGGWRFGPVASVTYLDGNIDGFTESTVEGSQAWNFIIDDRDIESLRFSAGAQADYVINTSFGVLIPGIRVSYVMETEAENERIGVQLANDPFSGGALGNDPLFVDVQARDDRFLDASLNLSAQFPMGISGFFSYNFYGAYDDFSKDAFTIGLRWDKPF